MKHGVLCLLQAGAVDYAGGWRRLDKMGQHHDGPVLFLATGGRGGHSPKTLDDMVYAGRLRPDAERIRAQLYSASCRLVVLCQRCEPRYVHHPLTHSYQTGAVALESGRRRDTPPCKVHRVYIWRTLQGGSRAIDPVPYIVPSQEVQSLDHPITKVIQVRPARYSRSRPAAAGETIVWVP
jgi:hypothetical protein